jgi:hypothetical protein
VYLILKLPSECPGRQFGQQGDRVSGPADQELLLLDQHNGQKSFVTEREGLAQMNVVFVTLRRNFPSQAKEAVQDGAKYVDQGLRFHRHDSF